MEVVGKEDGCGEGEASAGEEGAVSGWPSTVSGGVIVHHGFVPTWEIK